MTTVDLTHQECPRCGCVGYEVAGGCNGCYCHEEYPPRNPGRACGFACEPGCPDCGGYQVRL